MVLLEPWVERVVDLAWHGWVTRCGRVELGVPTIQQCNASGRWCGSRPVKAGELGGGCEARLRGAARRAGEALAEAGYHGPYGIDGYRWRDGAGGEHLRALGEINARYSMGWAVGTGAAGRRWVLEDP